MHTIRLFLINFFYLSTLFSVNNLIKQNCEIKITENEKKNIDFFLKEFLKNTYAGYVLFGDKPISLELISKPLNFCHNLNYDDAAFFLKNIINFLKKNDCPLNNIDNDFIIITNSKSFKNANKEKKTILFINKKAFIQKVNEHIILFKYVLGPNVTAQKLLEKLAHPHENILSAINNDVTLLGILLGYGSQNACYYSHMDRIEKMLNPKRKLNAESENFPLISYKEIYQKNINAKIVHKKFNCHPSFDFNSLKEEYENLKKSTDQTNKSKINYPTQLKFFNWPCDESENLIKKYFKTQKKLNQLINSNTIFEKFLKKIYGNPSLKITCSQSPKTNNKDYSNLIGKLFLDSFENFFDNNPIFTNSFIKGLKIEENINNKSFGEIICSVNRLNFQLKAKKNLDFANEFFKKLKNKKEIIPNRISYEIILNTNDQILEDFNNNVTLHYVVNRIDQKPLYPETSIGTVINEPISNFIPGIALALKGMKKNEIRKVYIHPSFAYGENTTLEPNVALVIQIQLLDFIKNDEKEVNFKEKKLSASKYNIMDIQKKLDQNLKLTGKILGHRNSKIIKKTHIGSIDDICHFLKNMNTSKVNVPEKVHKKEICDMQYQIINNLK